MFGGSKRRGAPAQPLTKETANANAATAAASAFMRRENQTPSLSSAAAAAALKARPMSPTIVADVQSKRVARRSPSVSSMTGRGRDTNRRQELTRTPSVGSMIERTFRSPSPGRSPAPLPRDVPPVPTVPIPNRSATDTNNRPLQTQTFRTASQRTKEGQGSWFGGATAGDVRTVRKASSAVQLSSRPPSEPRPGSVSPSINFSYPRGRMMSPTGSLRSLPSDDSTLVYDPNSRRMVPRASLFDDQVASLDLDKAANRKKKKKKRQDTSQSGSHLSNGTIGRIQGTAVVENTLEQPRTAARSKKTTKTRKQNNTIQAVDAADGEDMEMAAQEGITRHTLTKKPSIVREEPEREEEEELESRRMQSPSPHALDSVITVPNSDNLSSNQVMEIPNGQPKTPESKIKSSERTRVPSESPARSTRFASSTDQLVVKHDPPPRSISPRKSALKHASPTRAISPSDDGSDVSSVALNADDVNARKKAARVSWNDRNTVVVGVAAPQTQDNDSPVIPSPQTKKSWNNILGKHAKKDTSNVDKDETMSPRPMLPSFGSMRGKKSKDVEERALVRPNEIPSVMPSIEREQDASSSDDSLLDDTSDSDDESLVESTSVNKKQAALEPSNEAIPAISISQASPRPMDNGAELFENFDGHEASLTNEAAIMDDIEEEEAGDMYSDAHEELAVVDGDGFMSLDAVLESPPESPTVRKAIEGANIALTPAQILPPSLLGEDETSNDWANAKAYWKSLSVEKRRQLEKEAMEEAGDQQPLVHAQNDIQSTNGLVDHNIANQAVSNDQTHQTSLGNSAMKESTTLEGESAKSKSSKLRASMRNSPSSEATVKPQPAVGMRKSMREPRPVSVGNMEKKQPTTPNPSASTDVRMKKSLRERPSTADTYSDRPSILSTGRPASYHPDTSLSQQRKSSVEMPVPSSRGSGMKASLRRRGSDSSESSFTRARAGSGQGHGFRTSMRGSMREPAGKEANRYSLRPLSPTGFRRNSISSPPSSPPAFGNSRMRQSLRGESANAASRKRGSTFGRGIKGKKTKNGSRFVDSSDEDDGPLPFTRSRFADSSDEEDARPVSQGRGFPKSLRSKSTRATASAIDVRTSGLGFESPDPDYQPMQPFASHDNPTGSQFPPPASPALGTTAGSGPTRIGHSRRGSFMSILRRKKDVNKGIKDGSTSLEQNPQELGEIRANGAHKRDQSWPLLDRADAPGNHDAGLTIEKERPNTASGAAPNMPNMPNMPNKSNILRRRSASEGMVGLDHETLDADPQLNQGTDVGPQKKKKFGALRKMLGLHD